MIGKVLKTIARAAIAQPWDYQGDGAPGDWEFRVSPSEDHVAVFDPRRGTWVILDASALEPVAEEHSLRKMDEHTADWRQFVSSEDPDE
jgi:hypothetical protein